MRIISFTSGPVDTNSYIVVDEQTRKALVIDPSFAGRQILNRIIEEKLTVEFIINTHGHFDHTWSNEFLKKELSAKILIHKLDKDKLKHPDVGFFQLPFHSSKADGFLKNSGEIKLGSIIFNVIHTPGHSKGGICIYCKKEKVLFSGDTLFKGAHGRTDLHDSDEKEMFNNLKRLSKLPQDTEVYAGHGESTTIRDERKNNWFSAMENYYVES